MEQIYPANMFFAGEAEVGCAGEQPAKE